RAEMLNVIFVTGIVLALTWFVVTSFSRSSEVPPRTLERCPRPYLADADPVFAFQEVCRGVLDTNSLRFAAANAPADVVISFGTQQQRLARFSLQVASAMLVQRLARDVGSWRGFSRSLRFSMSKLRTAFLLG